MKKLTFLIIGSAYAANALAQGTVNFNMRLGGTAHVYAPLPGNANGTRIVGQGTNDGNPAGTTDYSGNALIGGNGLGTYPNPANYLAQLLGANGAGAPEFTLLPSTTPPVSFRTGSAAGAAVNGGATFANIPPDAPFGSFEVVAWDNSSGLYPTWTQASVAWAWNGQIVAGRSTEFTIANIGGNSNTPPGLFPGLTSFSLYIVPEPTTAALAGMGAAAFLTFRRRK